MMPTLAVRSTVAASLKAFMTRLIDYAGLFPPASLPLNQTVTTYARYQAGTERWMLGRFILPVGQLEAFGRTAQELAPSVEPFHLSVLGRGGQDIVAFLQNQADDLQAIQQFSERYPHPVESLEIRLPESAFDRTDSASDLIRQSHEGIADGITVFYEVPLNSNAHARIEVTARGIASLRRYDTGFKLRCGGVEAAAFPPTERIAFTIAACRDRSIPLKATAGLHHPIRRYDASVQTKMHGFLNVFGAGLLAHAHHLPLSEIVNMLEDEDARHFTFTEQAFTWRQYRIESDAIAALRERMLLSYGSCSFEEPVADLQSLGWLNSP